MAQAKRSGRSHRRCGKIRRFCCCRFTGLDLSRNRNLADEVKNEVIAGVQEKMSASRLDFQPLL
jgi:hypothetical protein